MASGLEDVIDAEIIDDGKKAANSMIVYDNQPDGIYDNFQFEQGKTGKGSVLGYGFGEIVEKVESSIVKKKDDPLYQASNSIANRLVQDRTFGSIIAIGIYYAISEFIGTKERKGTK